MKNLKIVPFILLASIASQTHGMHVFRNLAARLITPKKIALASTLAAVSTSSNSTSAQKSEPQPLPELSVIQTFQCIPRDFFTAWQYPSQCATMLKIQHKTTLQHSDNLLRERQIRENNGAQTISGIDAHGSKATYTYIPSQNKRIFQNNINTRMLLYGIYSDINLERDLLRAYMHDLYKGVPRNVEFEKCLNEEFSINPGEKAQRSPHCDTELKRYTKELVGRQKLLATDPAVDLATIVPDLMVETTFIFKN